MKMFYGNTPIKSLNIKHYEVSTNDATVIPSDLQAGITCYAKGKKVTGTGKSFSFATYGNGCTNVPLFIPDNINVIQIGSIQHPVKMIIPMKEMKTHDFTTAQNMAEIIIDGTTYPIKVSFQNGILTIACDQTINIELFYGKDEYI